jgi:hypothetical protein
VRTSSVCRSRTWMPTACPKSCIPRGDPSRSAMRRARSSRRCGRASPSSQPCHGRTPALRDA